MTNLEELKKILSTNKESKLELDKVVDKITPDNYNKILQLGNLTTKERKFLFELMVVNSLFFKNSERINKIIESYILLSKSDTAKLLTIISELYKTDINNQTSFSIANSQPKRF